MIGWKKCFLSLKIKKAIIKDVKITLNTKRIACFICRLKSSWLLKLSCKSLFKDLDVKKEKNPSTMNVKITVAPVAKYRNQRAAFCRRAFAYVEPVTSSGSRMSRYTSVLKKRCSSGDTSFTLFLFLKILLIQETTPFINFPNIQRLLFSLSKRFFICR